jgi:uncharacterized protein YaeQ
MMCPERKLGELMGHPSTLYRFRLDVSDVDRGVYEQLDFRVAMHPSETSLFLMTRVLAFALNCEVDLQFSSGGLSDPDDPCLSAPSPAGGFKTWIEIGNPSAKKLNKATKAARNVRIYTYKDPGSLVRELTGERIHRLEDVGLFSIKPDFLNRLASHIERDNRWSVIHTDGSLVVQIGERTEQGELERHQLTAP